LARIVALVALFISNFLAAAGRLGWSDDQEEAMNVRVSKGLMSVIALVGVAISACGSEETDGGEGGLATEPAGYQDNGGLVGRSHLVQRFRWSKGQARVTMMPHETHMCAMTMVRGDMARDTQIRIFKAGSNWVMEGLRPGSNFLEMEATCIALSRFILQSNWDRYSSGEWTITTSASNTTRSQSMWSDSAPILTGLQGQFDGGGERAWVSFPNAMSVNIKKGGAPGTHMAFAHSLLLGEEDPVSAAEVAVPKYMMFSLGVFTRSISLAKPSCTLGLCTPPVAAPTLTLGNVNEDFCFLTSISGDLNGAAEWAQVLARHDTNLWTFSAARGEGSVFAAAACLKIDQRPPQIVIPR
jgi:hypothetical protein